MKKILLSIATLALCGSLAMADDVVLMSSDATDIVGTDIPEVPASGNSNGTGRHIQPLESMKINGYSFTFSQGENEQNAPAYYYPMSTNPDGDKTVRVYKQNTMTVTAPEGVKFSKIVAIDKSTGTTGTTIYTGEAVNTFTFTATATVRAAKYVVTEGEGGGDTPGGEGTLFLSEDATECDFTLDNGTLPEGLDYVWSWKSYSGKYYLNASAYVNGAKYATDAYAYSPVVDLTSASSAKVSFDHAAKFQTNLRQDCRFVVREEGATEWTALTIPTWPEAGAWTWANSGEIDLASYVGKKIQVGFNYVSTDADADTWEVKNVKFDITSGIVGIEAVDNGEAVYYNLQGVRVANPENGLYIVVKNGKSTKVMMGK